ncbi:MAG: 5'/3'-nucleotidase SurE [Ferroplasma sp.]
MILVTNDDGFNSTGIKHLYKNASLVDDTIMIAPDRMRSASGMSITFTQPMRLEPLEKYGYKGYSTSGYPADAITMARSVILKNKRIDLVASGINLGSNISLRSLYASGTLSAAMAAALVGIKSMAFSMVTDSINKNDDSDFAMAGVFSKYFMSEFKKNGFPENVDVLNINYPSKITEDTAIRVVRMSPFIFEDFIEENIDPNGRKYYWMGNRIKPDSDHDTDYYALMEENNITVTPLTIHGNAVKDFNSTIKFVDAVSKAIYSDDVVYM